MTQGACWESGARHASRPGGASSGAAGGRPGLICGLAWLGLLILNGAVGAAEPSFPRGPGHYFSLGRLAVVVLVYVIWLRLTWWVDDDAREWNVPAEIWNPVMLATGLAGLLAVWVSPVFLVGLVLLIVLGFGPGLVYVYARNQRVPKGERVLTERHLEELAKRYLSLKFKKQPKAEPTRKVPMRFMGRGVLDAKEDPQRVARAQSSAGYQAALEMVWDAIQQRATDIHMEPTKAEMTVRFRVDGIMQPAESMTRAQGDAVLNIFKVLANLDITEKRQAQDGALSAQVEDRHVDFRVATAGGVTGEKLVMRILDKSKQVISFENLGMRPKLRERIHGLVAQPHGLIISCGPTGAGKSTTLYACLNEIDRYQSNVITIENPVEYHIDNVTQIEVNPKAGKTFASELRSILRQDPDVILIGEIRDQETAEIACQAAQTGHMVFTTLHANDTVTAVGRLIDLGVQPFMIAGALTAVLGQRLVRVLCPECKVRYKPNPDMLRKANLAIDKIKYFYRPAAAAADGDEPEGRCSHCGGNGYRGRTGVFELLVVNDALRGLIRESPNLNAIKQEAMKSGMKVLQEDGLRQVIEGITSIDEVRRVCK